MYFVEATLGTLYFVKIAYIQKPNVRFVYNTL